MTDDSPNGTYDAVPHPTRHVQLFTMLPQWIQYSGDIMSSGARDVWGILESSVNEQRNGDRSVWPKQEKIAAAIGASRNSVRKYLKELQDLRIIQVETKRGKYGHQHNTYVVSNVPPAGWSGPTSAKQFHERFDAGQAHDQNLSKETHAQNLRTAMRKNLSRPCAKSVQELEEGNHTKGTRPTKNTPPLASLTTPAPLFGEDEASTVDAGSKASKAKSGSDKGDIKFGEFWDAYGKKASKGAAEKAWRQAVKIADADKIIAAAAAVAAYHRKVETEVRFIKHPATWLNQKCWDDEPVGIAVAGNSKGHVPFTQDRSMWDNDEGGW